MKQTFFILTLLLGVFAASAHAQTSIPADTAHFTINQGNHAVGHTDFSILPTKQGSISTPTAYTVTSHGTLTVQNTKYSFSSSGTLDKDLSILQENLNGIVNGSAVTFAVQPSGGNFVIDISADGRSYRNSLNRPAQTVFFPDFDLSSYDIFLNLVARSPATPISALIPKQTGILIAATLAPQADVQGTLNGKALTLHHSSLTISSVVSELYYDSRNRILEVDIPSQTFAVVHDNFQLQPPPPPPANEGQQNQPAQPNQPQ
jgi:hypothetical protein